MKSNQKSILLIIANILFLFISIICLYCAFSAKEQWIVILNIICFILNFSSFIISLCLYEILKYKRNNKEECKKLNIRDCFEKDFLNSVLSYFIYNKGAFKYEDRNWIIENYYFVFNELHLEIISKNEMFKDTIIIHKDGTYNFKMNYNNYKSDILTSEEISKMIQLQKLTNI